MKAGEWVYLGFVERAHGLRGRVIARLDLAGSIGPVSAGTILRLDDCDHEVIRSTVRDSARVTLQFSDIHTREQAEGTKGMPVFIRRSSITPGEGIFPLHSFVGMEVRSDGFSGRVAGVESSPVNPCLLVEGEKGQFSVPVTMVAAGETDWESGVITVSLPEGLQEMTVNP